MNNKQKRLMKLARLLLTDENGISGEAFDQLWVTLKDAGIDCQKEIGDKVDATNGRWYFPSRSFRS